MQPQIRPLPVVLCELLPTPSQNNERPESSCMGNRAADGQRASTDGAGGVSEFLAGEERRWAYRLTDMRFTFEGGE